MDYHDLGSHQYRFERQIHRMDLHPKIERTAKYSSIQEIWLNKLRERSFINNNKTLEQVFQPWQNIRKIGEL